MRNEYQRYQYKKIDINITYYTNQLKILVTIPYAEVYRLHWSIYYDRRDK